MYIGRTPVIGNFLILDSISATATDTFALTSASVAYAPQSANHCIVSLNGVIQAPISSFTISGTNIVFASALTTDDTIDFIQVLGDVLNIGTPSDATVGIAKLSATGTKDATTFLRGDNTFASAGGANTPAFEAYNSAEQTGISDNVWTKMDFDTELFDTDSMFSASRFTPTIAGKYFVYGQAELKSLSSSGQVFNIAIYKNGSVAKFIANNTNASYLESGRTPNIDSTIEFNGSSDYVELYARVNVGTGSISIDTRATVGTFGGYKLII
jgi:hypothetical protein